MDKLNEEYLKVSEQAVISSFRYAKRGVNVRKRIPTRIMFDGDFIVTESKKTIWSMPGHAKNALRLHLNSIIARALRSDTEFIRSRGSHMQAYYISGDYTEAVMKKLIGEGRIQFVTVE